MLFSGRNDLLAEFLRVSHHPHGFIAARRTQSWIHSLPKFFPSKTWTAAIRVVRNETFVGWRFLWCFTNIWKCEKIVSRNKPAVFFLWKVAGGNKPIILHNKLFYAFVGGALHHWIIAFRYFFKGLTSCFTNRMLNKTNTNPPACWIDLEHLKSAHWCSWSEIGNPTVGGWNPANQLRLVVYPNICQGFIHARWSFGISSMTSPVLAPKTRPSCPWNLLHPSPFA